MSKNAVLGCELNDLFLQISFAGEGEAPVTLKMPGKNELLQIPLVIGKQKGDNQWYYGQEAYDKITRREGNIAVNLLSGLGSDTYLAGEKYTYAELLHVFLGHAIRVAMHAAEELSGEPVEFLGMTLSVEPFLPDQIPHLESALGNLPIQKSQIFLQGHEESLFSYLIHQPEKLLGYVTGVFDLTGEQLVTYCMEMNPSTSPVVTSVVREETGLIKKKHYPSIMEHDRALAELDEKLADYAQRFTAGRIVTSIYLIGDGFSKDWYVKSRHVLCRSRKVYAGNNLFSKGAAYSAAGRFWPGLEKEDFLFLGRDMLRFNIGMKAMEEGKEVYVPLLDAGSNYYDATGETEVLLAEPDGFSLWITPIFGGDSYEKRIEIGEHERREGRAFRYLVRLQMKTATRLQVSVSDEGFGSFFAPRFTEKVFDIDLEEAK